MKKENRQCNNEYFFILRNVIRVEIEQTLFVCFLYLCALYIVNETCQHCQPIRWTPSWIVDVRPCSRAISTGAKTTGSRRLYVQRSFSLSLFLSFNFYDHFSRVHWTEEKRFALVVTRRFYCHFPPSFCVATLILLLPWPLPFSPPSPHYPPPHFGWFS